MTVMCLAIPGRILDVTGDDPLLRTGRVSFGGAVKEVNLAYVPEARVGDYVIVHVGFAISLLDEAEAARVWAALDALAAASTASEGGDALPR
jgi:hydrogenase expression/formation protein HypC